MPLNIEPQYAAAFRDIGQALAQWPVWTRLGWREVRRYYVRSVLGPFWTTFSLGVLVATLSVVWVNLWDVDLATYLPFVSAGLICWALISAIIIDSCTTYLSAEPLIRSFRFPYALLSLAQVWKNLIFFLHNLVIYVAVALFAGVPVTWATLLVVPALFLLWLNGFWLATLLALLGARFRDVRQLALSAMQILFFVTPIFWSAEQIHQRASPYLVDMNVLFHYVEILRMPMLGRVPAASSWLAVVACTLVGWLITLWFYSRFRRRIPYWL